MRIAQITVTYTISQEISDTRTEQPALTYTATLDDGDDPDVVEAALWTIVRSSVREQVDMALHARERNGQ